MKNALRLVRVDFDTLENDINAALSTQEIGVFVDDDFFDDLPGPVRTAHAKVGEALRTLPPVAPYLGWDQNVYPQFRVERVVVS